MKMNKLIPSIATLLIAAGSLHAQVNNGDFNAGLTAWTSTGDVGIRDGAAFLTTADLDELPVKNFSGTDTTGSFGASGLEGFSNLSDGTLDPDAANGIFALEGSAFKQNGIVLAGSTISFQWRFFTDDLSPSAANGDYAYIVIDDGTTPVVLTLATTADATGSAFYSYSRSTALNQYTSGIYAVDTPITLTFGVVEVGDDSASSALLVDNVSIPEPTSIALLSMAGFGLLFRKRRIA